MQSRCDLLTLVYCQKLGLVLLAEVGTLDLKFLQHKHGQGNAQVTIDGVDLRLHLCADTMTSVSAFIGDFQSAFKPAEESYAMLSLS